MRQDKPGWVTGPTNRSALLENIVASMGRLPDTPSGFAIEHCFEGGDGTETKTFTNGQKGI